MTPGPAATPAASGARWRRVLPFGLWALLAVLPPPAGLAPQAWSYFAVFAAAVCALMVTPWPGGAIGLVAVSAIAAAGLVDADPARSVAWALGSFADTTVWLTFGAFLFAIGYRNSGLGRRIALLLVRALGRRTLGLGYAIALSDLALAPGTPSNTARSGGTIYPVVRQIPPLYGAEPGPDPAPIGTYVMWTAFAATAVTSSSFVTALVPNAAALALASRSAGLDMSWSRFTLGFAPAALLLLALVPLLAHALIRPAVARICPSGCARCWSAGEVPLRAVA